MNREILVKLQKNKLMMRKKVIIDNQDVIRMTDRLAREDMARYKIGRISTFLGTLQDM